MRLIQDFDLNNASNKIAKISKAHYLKPLYFLFIIFLPFWVWLIFNSSLDLVDLMSERLPTGAADIRAHFYSIGLSITGLGALLAAPFVLIRAWVHERQTTTSEQGLITDRITKAVEQLGSQKEVKIIGGTRQLAETAPNIEVRIGAIYALARIAEDSERDYIPIMRTLSAYLEQNSPLKSEVKYGSPPWQLLKDYSDKSSREAQYHQRKKRFGQSPGRGVAKGWASKLPSARGDIQAILNVIGSRTQLQLDFEKAKGFRVRIADANLQNVRARGGNLSNVDFFRVNLSGANLENTNLSLASFQNCTMIATDIRGATGNNVIFNESYLEGANFQDAKFENASFRMVVAQGVNFEQSKLQSADFSGAKLQGSFFRNAELSNSSFRGVGAEGAEFTYANLDGCNFSGALLHTANIRATHAHNATFIGIKGVRINFQGSKMLMSKFSRSNLFEATFINADVSSCDFSRCIVEKGDFHKVTAERCIFSKSILRYAKFNSSKLNESAFDQADLTQAEFKNAQMYTCKLSDAVLCGASFYNFRWKGSSAHGADFSGVSGIAPADFDLIDT